MKFCARSNAAGLVAAATNHQVSRRVPTASPTPVIRCVMDRIAVLGSL